MDHILLGCQVCLTTFERISELKTHMHSGAHQKKMKDIFQQDIFVTHGMFPCITLLNQKTRPHQMRQPIIGLSICFSREKRGAFYLCHICEQKINTTQIMPHLGSIDHGSNYFNHTNPNALSFSWIPSRNMRHILRSKVTQDAKERAQLQVLDLPGDLLTQLISCTYSEVMDTFSENKKLVKQIEAVKPKRTMIQTYQRDRNREHPLLGLQHLIECICVGQTERRYYLCTLCHLTLPTRMIIKHVLSFDHIFSYFRAWHPSTLLARESYMEYTAPFASRMRNLAKQTEEIHEAANTDMKQVSLEPAKFTSVNSISYAKALEELESIRKENKEDSLITVVTPGNKLEVQHSQQEKMGSNLTSSNLTSSNLTSSKASSNSTSSKASSNPASSNSTSSNLTSSNPTSSKASSNSTSSKASSNPASSNPTSSKASTNPASSNPASSKASSNPASSNSASSKLASSKLASSNPASSKASSNLTSSKASTNSASTKLASSNPASSNLASSNSTSSNPASSKANSNPASSNPASSKASSNPASSNPASSNPASSNPATSNPASSNPASSSLTGSNPTGSNLAISKASSNPASSNPASSNPASSTPSKPSTSLEPQDVSYKLQCQNCRESFKNMRLYCRHVSTWEHKKMLKKSHNRGSQWGWSQSQQTLDEEWKPCLILYKYLVGTLRQNQSVAGIPLIVTLISTEVQNEPIYMCFACEDCLSESSVRDHVDSRKHLIQTMLYQNPWRLTFAWENHMYMKDLRSMAWEEEKKRPNQMILKVLDIPNWMLESLRTLGYVGVMKTLELQHTLLLRDVPKCETYSKLQQNERFPLLGKQFLVMYDCWDKAQQTTGVAFLCLLCTRTLTDDECYAHVFSREHVATFLDRFHPGSLDSNADAETVLDLAKQAANIHSISHVQVIELETPIWHPCSYSTALNILIAASKREGKARLLPAIVPRKKMIPRGTLKDVDHVRDNNEKNSRMTEGCEETKSQKSTDDSETTLNTVSVENGAEVTSSQCVTATPGEKESEQRGGVSSETGSEEVKNAGTEACQAIKEKIKETTAGSGEMPENSLNTDKNHPTETGKERSKDVLTQKRKVSPGHVEDVEQETSHKRQRLTCKEDISCDKTPNLTSSKMPGLNEATSADKAEISKQSHKTATNKALSAPVECDTEERDPFYLCERCSVKIPEKDYISHVTGADHQRMMGLQKLPCPPETHQGETVRDSAALFEQENGYGAAQVVDLDGETLSKISKQNLKSAIQMVKGLHTQQDSSHELPSTSALCGVQPVHTSVPLHAQHEVCSSTDKYQVEDMEIDSNSEDSETIAVSAMPETTSSTTKVPPQVSQSADTHPREDKAQIISNTTAGPLKMAAADSPVTTQTTSSTAISKFTAKFSNSAPDTTKSTAPTSRLTAPTSSCTTATKKLRETISVCTATTSTSSATISRATSTTKSTLLSKLVEHRTGAAAKVPATSHKAAASSNTESKVAREAVCRTAPASKMGNKNSENASKTVVASHAVGTSAAAAKMTVKCLNTEASVKTAHTSDVAPDIHKSKAPADHHMMPPKNPPTQPSHSHASKHRYRASPYEVGLNQLIKVTCEGKKQVYCLLCSVRLSERWHVFSYTHQYKYAKMKLPERVSQLKPSELSRELPKMVAQLAEANGDAGPQFFSTVRVNLDEYRDLAALPAEKAIERLKALVRQKDSRVSSTSTTDMGVSPCEASSPDDSNFKCPFSAPAFRAVKPQHCASPLATEATGSRVQTPDTCQETPAKTQQQERSRPDLQGTQKVLEGSQKASSVKLLKPDRLSSAAAVTTDQQTQPGPRRREQHVSKHSQAPPMISIGESIEARSNLSTIYLKGTSEPVIGLGFVWECRGISRHTFYLCESCSKTLPIREICQHMVSAEHQYNFLLRQHPGFLYFWADECLLPWMKRNILKGIAMRLSKRERFNEMDAQVLLLGPEMCELVRAAPFSDALKMVQNIKEKKKLIIPHSAIVTPQQKDKQPESRRSPEESPPAGVQPSQALETDQRSDNGARQKTEEHHLEETVGDLDGVRLRSPVDVTRVSSKVDPVSPFSPFSDAGTSLSPQEQPEPRNPVSQQARPNPELQVKQAELHSESPSSSIVSPKTSQTLTVSPRDEHFPTRKRAAVESVETLVRSCSDDPQLVDPPPANQPVSPKTASQSTSVNPAATSTPLSPMFKDADPGSDEQDINIERPYYDALCGLVQHIKSSKDTSVFLSALGNGKTTTSCANSSSESAVERRLDPEPVQTTLNVATKQARCDSTGQMLDVTKNPPSANSLETVPPEVLSCDNTLSNASSAFTSSLEDSTLTRVDPLSGETAANKTDPDSDPQTQMDAQSTRSHPSLIYDNPGQIPQPDNTETGNTGVHQLPINPIVTVRSKRPNQWLVGNYNGQDNSEVNQVTHGICTVAEVGASGGYGQYSQVAYVTKGQSDHFPSEDVGSYTAPANPSVYTASSYQCEGYATRPYPEQEATRFSLQSFGHNLAAPPWVRLGLYQQQLLQQQYSSRTNTSLAAGEGTVISEAAYGGGPYPSQPEQETTGFSLQSFGHNLAAPPRSEGVKLGLYQQQLLQQQYSSWTSTSLAAGEGTVISEEPTNSSPKMINLNDYRTGRVALTQNSSNVATQNVPQAYVNPPVFHYLPAANTEVTAQPPAGSFLTSGGGVYVVEK